MWRDDERKIKIDLFSLIDDVPFQSFQHEFNEIYRNSKMLYFLCFYSKTKTESILYFFCNIFSSSIWSISNGGIYHRKKNKQCFLEEQKPLCKCVLRRNSRNGDSNRCSTAQDYTYINILWYHTVFKGHFIRPHWICVSIWKAMRTSRFGCEFFFPMYLLNGHFYGYSRSHKLYFEQTNISYMTEQTTVTFFLFTNAIQFRQIVITAVQTSDFCFYRFDIIHDCSFLSLVSLYKTLVHTFTFYPFGNFIGLRKEEKGR